MIAERGLAGTRIADVAQRVATSSAAVLYWFSSKDELLAEALIADEERFADELVSALAAIADPAAKLLRLIDGLAVQVTLGDATISRGFMRDICVESADRMLGVDLRAAAASAGEAVSA